MIASAQVKERGWDNAGLFACCESSESLARKTRFLSTRLLLHSNAANAFRVEGLYKVMLDLSRTSDDINPSFISTTFICFNVRSVSGHLIP